MRTNDRAVVLVGIAVWAVLLVVALVLRERLVEQGRGWWVWTPVAGLALGGYGLDYVRRRDRRAARVARAAGSGDPAARSGSGDVPGTDRGSAEG